MITKLFLSGFSNWDNPITYLCLLVLFVVFLSVPVLLQAKSILKEEGIEIIQVIFNNSFGGIFKWSSTHQTRVAILLIVIVLLGIIWALTAGVQ